jgi:hypothetical protein
LEFKEGTKMFPIYTQMFVKVLLAVAAPFAVYYAIKESYLAIFTEKNPK